MAYDAGVSWRERLGTQWPVALSDMREAARCYSEIRDGARGSSRGLLGLRPVRTALLGGAFLSWASGHKARDFDIYVEVDAVTTLNGWCFCEDGDPASAGYRRRAHLRQGTPSGRRWKPGHPLGRGTCPALRLGTIRSVHPRGQPILTDADHFPVWWDFDYEHCMVGVVDEDEVVTHGAWCAAMGRLIATRSEDVRDEEVVRRKLVSKPFWGCAGPPFSGGDVSRFGGFSSMSPAQRVRAAVAGLDEVVRVFVSLLRTGSEEPAPRHEGPDVTSGVVSKPVVGSTGSRTGDRCYNCDAPASVRSDSVPLCERCSRR